MTSGAERANSFPGAEDYSSIPVSEKKGGLYERIGGAKWAMNFWGVEDHSVIPISGTRGCLVHISGRPRVRAGKIKKESGKQFHFPFMLGNL